MQCEFAQHLKKGPTVGESNTWITQETSLRNHCMFTGTELQQVLTKTSSTVRADFLAVTAAITSRRKRDPFCGRGALSFGLFQDQAFQLIDIFRK
jgi:hypothetical protein